MQKLLVVIADSVHHRPAQGRLRGERPGASGSVIASHANEPATVSGKLVVHVPLSGRTMEFDGSGRCIAGC